VEHVAPALEETDIAQSQVQRFAIAPAGIVDPAVHLVVLQRAVVGTFSLRGLATGSILSLLKSEGG
jgi:hypothetical protein